MNFSSLKDRCPVCENTGLLPFFRLEDVPVFCNRLVASSREAIEAAVGQIDLVYCAECGHVWNRAFEPELAAYDPDYHNPLEVSECFLRYSKQLAQDLIDRLRLHGGTVVEVGCGDGNFLELICSQSESQGVGFDPAHTGPEFLRGDGYEIAFIREMFGNGEGRIRADLVCCRQTLEHVAEPLKFMRTLREELCTKKTCGVFFEVPNSLFSFRDLSIWDLIYEHFSYFCPRSLRRLFHRTGFGLGIVSKEYAGQFLGIYAGPGSAAPRLPVGDETPTVAEITGFGERFTRKLEKWRSRLAELRRKGLTAAVWGAGSKGTMFVNLTRAGEEISAVVDVNPRKQGKFVARTGHPIVAPSDLLRDPPAEIIVMNRIYAGEIQALVDRLGLKTTLVFA